MAYPIFGITYEYYTTEYHGHPIVQENFPKLLARSMDVLYPMIRERSEIMFGRNDYVDEQLKRGICSQIEYLAVETGGGVDLTSLISSGDQSFTIGKFSASKAPTSNAAVGGLSGMISQKAIGHLASVGLIDNRVESRYYDWY